MFHLSFRCFSRVFQRSFKGLSVKIQRGFKRAFNVISWKMQCCFISVSLTLSINKIVIFIFLFTAADQFMVPSFFINHKWGGIFESSMFKIHKISNTGYKLEFSWSILSILSRSAPAPAKLGWGSALCLILLKPVETF